MVSLVPDYTDYFWARTVSAFPRFRAWVLGGCVRDPVRAALTRGHSAEDWAGCPGHRMGHVLTAIKGKPAELGAPFL